jgi:hypothetical protein
LVWLMLFFVLCVMDDVFFLLFSSLFSISIHICQISFLYCSPLFFSFIWKKLQSYFFSGGELISLQRCFISCWCKTAFWIYISVKVWMVFSRKKKRRDRELKLTWGPPPQIFDGKIFFIFVF